MGAATQRPSPNHPINRPAPLLVNQPARSPRIQGLWNQLLEEPDKAALLPHPTTRHPDRPRPPQLVPSAASLHRVHSDLTVPPRASRALGLPGHRQGCVDVPAGTRRSGPFRARSQQLASPSGSQGSHVKTSRGFCYQFWAPSLAGLGSAGWPQTRRDQTMLPGLSLRLSPKALAAPGCLLLRKGGSCPSPTRHGEGKAASGVCEGGTRCQPLIPTPLTALSPAFHPDTAPGVR